MVPRTQPLSQRLNLASIHWKLMICTHIVMHPPVNPFERQTNEQQQQLQTTTDLEGPQLGSQTFPGSSARVTRRMVAKELDLASFSQHSTKQRRRRRPKPIRSALPLANSKLTTACYSAQGPRLCNELSQHNTSALARSGCPGTCSAQGPAAEASPPRPWASKARTARLVPVNLDENRLAAVERSPPKTPSPCHKQLPNNGAVQESVASSSDQVPLLQQSVYSGRP